AWGELDPDFGNKQIVLALTQDGQSLATQGPRLVVPGDVRGGRYVSGVETIRLDRAQQPTKQSFRSVRRPNDIETGPDLGGPAHTAINFTGSAGSSGDAWVTVYDLALSTASATYGSVRLATDVLVHTYSNIKGAGPLALYNEAPGKKGLA